MPMFNYNNIDNIQICMDVPFLDHPYLIGPRGRKCQHLMDRYRSLIHFPDSNRRPNGPKLNNVIINGSSKNAEELRFQIRSRTPIRLALFLQNLPDADGLCSQMESAIADRSLPIRLNYTDDYSNAMLKTEWRNEEALVNFCNEFIQIDSKNCNNNEDMDLFTMALTILPVVNPWNPDISQRLIEHINSVTGCQVSYPPKEKFSDQPPSYFIKGSTAAGVLKAGKYMMGLTMFQVSFVVPNSVQLNLNDTMEWQRDLLVHTSIEPVFVANDKNVSNSEFTHNRAILRSFEFCLNSVYFVRSLLLGFKKTVQSSHYSFMSEIKAMIPCSVFSEGQLYFPLYAIDDERSFNFDTSGVEFFKKFYGGPYSAEKNKENNNDSNLSPPVHDKSINLDLTFRLKSLLNISVNSDTCDLSSVLNKTGISDSSNDEKIENMTEEVEVARNDTSNLKEKFSPLTSNTDEEPTLLSDSPQVSPITVKKHYLPFKQFGNDGDESSMMLSNCCISATSPDTVDHEDDPELQAILRRAMPCLKVTQKQVESMDHERISRSLMTADGLAIFTNAPCVPFVHSAYAVSYPANVEPSEFERQFKEFVKMRKAYLKVRRITRHDNSHEASNVTSQSSPSIKSPLRRSASF